MVAPADHSPEDRVVAPADRSTGLGSVEVFKARSVGQEHAQPFQTCNVVRVLGLVVWGEEEVLGLVVRVGVATGCCSLGEEELLGLVVG